MARPPVLREWLLAPPGRAYLLTERHHTLLSRPTATCATSSTAVALRMAVSATPRINELERDIRLLD